LVSWPNNILLRTSRLSILRIEAMAYKTCMRSRGQTRGSRNSAWKDRVGMAISSIWVSEVSGHLDCLGPPLTQGRTETSLGMPPQEILYRIIHLGKPALETTKIECGLVVISYVLLNLT